MFKTLLKNTDYVILAVVLILFAIGVIGIYSAGYNTTINKDEYIKQLIWFSVMIIAMIIIWAVDYNTFDIFGYVIYFFSLIALIAVLFTSSLMGANSWFNLGPFLYQPSELMKIGYILCISKVLSLFAGDILTKKQKIIKISLVSIMFILPFVLILLQPDFGTAAVFLVITFFILFSSGLKYRYIFGIIATILILAPLVYFFILNPVQQDRILVFLNPELDPLGSGYNAIQSKIAVGSGMIFGTGLLKGTQTQFGYLPIKSSDFIFSVLSEELGFVMSVLIVLLYVILIIRLIKVASEANDNFARYIVIGITGMIFFHFVQNIGMTIGLLPITGVPLPFVSYGGSSLMTNLIAIAIVLNISARKNKSFLF
ncbi:MAG: rod shape-determining protein RodA [Clostridia bacterium]